MAISTKKTRPLKPADMKALGQAAECLKTLAHPVRIRMVQLLLHGRYTVGELAEDCDVPDNVASEHLQADAALWFLSQRTRGSSRLLPGRRTPFGELDGLHRRPIPGRRSK